MKTFLFFLALCFFKSSSSQIYSFTKDGAYNIRFNPLTAERDTIVTGNLKTINGASISGFGDLGISGVPVTLISLASNFVSTSTTLANVTGWSFSVTSGKSYRIEIIADYQTAATTTGGIIAYTLTSGTGTIKGFIEGDISQSAVATTLRIPIRAIGNSGTAGSSLTTTGVSVINSPHSIHSIVVFTCATSGTLQIQWASEVAASSSQLNAGSSLIYQQLN